ncbi:MAG: hypothetical protein CYPHOPRED_003710, partial [Cyphobasidiales sp. Tagirdzhanova-0007]
MSLRGPPEESPTCDIPPKYTRRANLLLLQVIAALLLGLVFINLCSGPTRLNPGSAKVIDRVCGGCLLEGRRLHEDWSGGPLQRNKLVHPAHQRNAQSLVAHQLMERAGSSNATGPASNNTGPASPSPALNTTTTPVTTNTTGPSDKTPGGIGNANNETTTPANGDPSANSTGPASPSPAFNTTTTPAVKNTTGPSDNPPGGTGNANNETTTPANGEP